METPSSGTKDFWRSPWKLFLFAALAVLPAALAVLPVSFFESAPSLCLIKSLFHMPCPGCGMTRALSCVLHGRFLDAAHENPLVVFLFPLLSFVWIKTLVREWKEIRS